MVPVIRIRRILSRQLAETGKGLIVLEIVEILESCGQPRVAVILRTGQEGRGEKQEY